MICCVHKAKCKTRFEMLSNTSSCAQCIMVLGIAIMPIQLFVNKAPAVLFSFHAI